MQTKLYFCGWQAPRFIGGFSRSSKDSYAAATIMIMREHTQYVVHSN